MSGRGMILGRCGIQGDGRFQGLSLAIVIDALTLGIVQGF